MTPEQYINGEGKLYLAPADTEPPTSTSKEALEAAGWQFIGKIEDDGTVITEVDDVRPAQAAAMATTWGGIKASLELTYMRPRPPEPYRANRAARRAAARAVKRGQR